MKYEPYHVETRFFESRPLVYMSECDDFSLRCHWLDPKWLKAVNRFLRKLFFFDMRRVEPCFNEIHIKRNSIKDSILEQDSAIQMIYDRRTTKILMGPRQAGLLYCEVSSPFDTQLEIPLKGPRGFQVYGITVEVIPWMDGVLPLPDEKY